MILQSSVFHEGDPVFFFFFFYHSLFNRFKETVKLNLPLDLPRELKAIFNFSFFPSLNVKGLISVIFLKR